ncbi:MAG: gephyrin-like molybdotransferase Glp [Planctomycetota bacterium]
MVRELGSELLPIEEVRETIFSLLSPLEAETCRIEAAQGRVLRSDVVANESIPPFDNSAMDGYGIIAADLAPASPESPIRLIQDAEVAAGDVPDIIPRSGACVRIMTGAPVPDGIDAVVPHELTTKVEGAIQFTAPIPAGKNIRRQGTDMKPGDTPLRAGQVLNSARLAIAATLGAAELEVTRPMRVAILSPGSELVRVDETPGPGQIRNSNAISLAGALRDAGAEPIDLGIVTDDLDTIRQTVEKAFEDGADAVVSSGGVSAGDYDFIRDLVRDVADPGHHFKVALRPGKPLAFGLFGGKPLFGLPGNPASSIVSFEVFVRPALRAMRGESEVLAPEFGVRFPFEYRYRGGRPFLLRTKVEADPESLGSFRVVPPGEQDSSFLASMAHANALVILPADADVVSPGEVLPAIWLGSHRP